MNKAETKIIAIRFPNDKPLSYGEREKYMNVEIQKQIDLFNQQGYGVMEKTPINKTASTASIKFVIQKYFNEV
jgi:hypothetical protein